MNRQINSYLPEKLFPNAKQGRTARICREQCAVIDLASNGLILASRGGTFPVGTSLEDALAMTAEEKALFRTALTEHRRSMLQVGTSPLLLLADWLPSLSLALVILPNGPAQAWAAALCESGRTDVENLLPKDTVRAKSFECRAAASALSELLPYVDRLLSPIGRTADLFSVAASFAGCSAELDDQTSRTLSALPRPHSTTAAFLLCAMLNVRERLGRVRADADTPTLAVSLLYAAAQEKDDATPPLFLSSLAFRGCRMMRKGEETVLCLPQSSLAVRATQATDTLCIRIRPIPFIEKEGVTRL